jgi:hypothetical protein
MNTASIAEEYQYRPYPGKRIGIFSVEKEPSEYTLPGGWVREEKKIEIIGETDDTYVDKLQELNYGEWFGDKLIQQEFLIPLGVHKSRLIKWIPYQLELF